ncbi:MAG: hypothetical protein R3E14_00805 [Erythrobacter sp.]
MAVMMAITALALAVVLIRLGWGGREGLSGVGWAVATLSLTWLTWSDGAWGLATGLTAGAIFALVLVLYAGAISPRSGARRAAANVPVRLSNRAEGFGRRTLVFLLVVPLSFAAAQWLAFAIAIAMKANAPLDANSVSTMMFVQPSVWAILMVWQMVLAGPREMLAPPVIVAGIATLIWVAA